MREQQIDRRLTGGLTLVANKALSTAQPIRRGFIPARLVIAMRQHRGNAAEPVVQVGEYVRKGQQIGRAGTTLSAAVHASSSGRISAIEQRLVPGGRRLHPALCICIDTDGLDAACEDRIEWPATREERMVALRSAGIAGLGGAAYPTADKAGAGAETPCRALVINGAECEPYISCDDMLMREAAADILQGALALADLLDAPAILVAVERDKPQALEAMGSAAEALGDARLQLSGIPTIYPAGAERQLIELLTGQQVPSGCYPAEIGFPCQNVGTSLSIGRLVQRGEPLVTRIVTVTGLGIASPANVEVPIGTVVSDLTAYCGGYSGPVARLLLGGSMMGYALPSDDIPVTKATNCIVAASAEEVHAKRREWPCIRCGECSNVCPVRLMPQDLLAMTATGNHEALQQLGLDDCIECGCCDVVCPSHIALTEHFRHSKPELQRHREQLRFSADSQERSERRRQRQHAAEARDRAQQEALRASLLRHQHHTHVATVDTDQHGGEENRGG